MMRDDDDMLLRLQQLAALGELAAGVTHETRNALTSIVGFVQLARHKNGETEACKRHLELIEREAMRAVEILEQFLQLAREPVGRERSEEIDIAQVVAEIASATSYRASLRKVAIVADATVPRVRISLRRGALLQVLLNLVLNALDAARGSVEITAVIGDRGLEVVVADNGLGVPAELREKIFAPFFTTKPSGEGTGLGLAVSRRLVESAGGTLVCEEHGGGGAAFRVQLPVEDAR
jgi:signal transduction histidine kinase